MKKFGSKDVMRMESIRSKANGDYLTQVTYAYNMACAITDPGKAMARGFAALFVYGEHSVMGSVFFERAHDLGGEDVRPTVSVNPWDPSEEGIEAEFIDIPKDEQPASRRDVRKEIAREQLVNVKRSSFSNLAALGRLSLTKGTGTQFSLYDYPSGTIEVWQSEDKKYKLVYTGHYESSFYINEKRDFSYTSIVAGNKSNKRVNWTLIDYIESRYATNLAPLYGKSLSIFCYD